jgi:PAS domain S-box-containing protein
MDPGTLNHSPADPSVLQTILDTSTEYSIVATDLRGDIVLWNEGARRIYGYAPDEAIGQNLRVLHTPAEVEAGKVDEILATAQRRGQWEGVVSRVAKDGRTFPTRTILTVRRDASGAPLGYLSISKDISDELRLNQRLLDSEEYNRVIIESAIDGLVVTTATGEITDVNRQMERITGASRDQLIGTSFFRLVVPRTAAEEALQRVNAEGRATDVELRVIQADGSLRDYAFNANTLGEHGRAPRRVIATVRDVTDQKRLRDELEQRNRELEVQNERVLEASRLKSEFLASMSHELRTPLNSIIGFSDFLLTAPDEPLSGPQREYLSDILNSGNHLLQLINDILDLSKVESGKLALSPVPTAIREAVEEVGSSLRPQFVERSLDLSIEVAPSIDRVLLDPLRFKQILYNLLSNSAKFTPPHGRVEVEVTPALDSRFAVRVTDTGIGIPKKDLPRIFREFEQLDSGPGRRYSGTGLGLPLTQKLIDLMGGSIEVMSEVGVGTTFVVRLPLMLPPLPPIDAPNEGVRA